MSIHRILVGLDGSSVEHKVLQAARAHADAWKAKLILFRAVTLPVEVLPQMFDVSPEQVAGILESSARRHLDGLAREIPQSTVRVALGSPWRTLCEAAQAENADLIVIGSHGYGGVDRLLGTTAARIVNHADRAVLVVRP